MPDPFLSPSSLVRTQNFYWSTFLVLLFVPLLGSALSPLPFGFIMPLAGAVFFPLHKYLFGTWPLLRTKLPGLLPLMAFLIALILMSYFWSVNPEESLKRAYKVALLIVGSFGTIAVAQYCPDTIWKKYSLLFPFAVFVVGVVTIFDLYSGLPVYRLVNHTDFARNDFLNKNSSVFAMALPVAVYLAWQGRSLVFTISLVILGIIMLFLTSSQACQLSLLVIVFGAFGCIFFLEKLTMRTAFIGMAFLFLMLPWIAPTAFDLLAAKISQSDGVLADASTSPRLENWDFLARRIFESPLTGFGIDSTRYMTFDTQEIYFHNNTIMHPHNIALQMWIEFGVFGALWSVVFLGYSYVLMCRLPAHARRLSFLTFVGVMVFLLVSWSIWSSWLDALILYLACLCVLATKTSTDPAHS